MASCNDCLHVDVCRGIYLAIISGEINSYEEFLEKCEKEHFEKQDISPCNCLFYKDRSRFVELPCKVGDTLYFNNVNLRNAKVIAIYVDASGGMFDLDIATNVATVAGYKHFINKDYTFEDIGKRLFLTKEAAEQALKERENNENQ